MKNTYNHDTKAQQVPNPTPAAEGSGPASGKRDARGVHPAIGRIAYIGAVRSACRMIGRPGIRGSCPTVLVSSAPGDCLSINDSVPKL
jgi:hypothetical protein